MKQLIEHLITQSTVVCAVDHQGESLEDAVQWLEEEMRIFFQAAPEVTFPFGGHIY